MKSKGFPYRDPHSICRISMKDISRSRRDFLTGIFHSIHRISMKDILRSEMYFLAGIFHSINRISQEEYLNLLIMNGPNTGTYYKFYFNPSKYSKILC